MVKFFFILSAMLFAQDTPVSVELHFSKPRVYVGEQVIAEFYVVSSSPHVDVEVVKFPEFRGFWSENQALRQGLLPMLPVSEKLPKLPIWGQHRFQVPATKFKGLVGAYSLIPMLMKKDWKIEPMKVLVRGDGAEDKILTHAVPALPILELPAPPSLFHAKSFFGAVGTFRVEMDQTEIGFRDNEAASVRVGLVGEGNFSEIDNLPLSLPAIVEPVSTRTFTNAHAGTGMKSFEWDVVVHSDQDFSIDESNFCFFNPKTEKYEFTQIPKLRFAKLPPLPSVSPEVHLRTRGTEAHWSKTFSLQKSFLFWGAQALLFAFYLFQLFPLLFPKSKKVSVSKESYQKKLDTLAAQVEDPAPQVFMGHAYQLMMEYLEQTQGTPLKHLTHRELLAQMPGELKNLTSDLIPIINSYNSIGYSPDKKSPHTSQEVHTHLKNLVLKKVA